MILRLLEDEAEFLTKTERKKHKNTHKKYWSHLLFEENIGKKWKRLAQRLLTSSSICIILHMILSLIQ